MIYGVKIGEKHSIDDWGVFLTKKIIAPPEVQTNYIKVPQRDGKVDLSESLNGLVKYYNRIITLEFKLKENIEDYAITFSEIQNYCHGKRMKLIFDDDSDIYYIGRVSVNNNEVAEKIGIISITVDCDPYKYDLTSSDEMWLWDTFDFEDGVINEFIDVEVDGTETVELIAKRQVTYPTIASDSAMTVEFDGVEYSLSVGENKMYDILLPEGENELIFRGHGTVTIRYRGGSL